MKWKIVVLMICIFLCVGCGEVIMSPRMQQITRMSAINVRNMCKDCQGGNEESCEKGLVEAAKTLELIVEAM